MGVPIISSGRIFYLQLVQVTSCPVLCRLPGLTPKWGSSILNTVSWETSPYSTYWQRWTQSFLQAKQHLWRRAGQSRACLYAVTAAKLMAFYQSLHDKCGCWKSKSQHSACVTQHMSRVGQNRVCTPYMTVCMAISLPKIPYIHRIYECMYGCGQLYVWGVWPSGNKNQLNENMQSYTLTQAQAYRCAHRHVHSDTNCKMHTHIHTHTNPYAHKCLSSNTNCHMHTHIHTHKNHRMHPTCRCKQTYIQAHTCTHTHKSTGGARYPGTQTCKNSSCTPCSHIHTHQYTQAMQGHIEQARRPTSPQHPELLAASLPVKSLLTFLLSYANLSHHVAKLFSDGGELLATRISHCSPQVLEIESIACPGVCNWLIWKLLASVRSLFQCLHLSAYAGAGNECHYR